MTNSILISKKQQHIVCDWWEHQNKNMKNENNKNDAKRQKQQTNKRTKITHKHKKNMKKTPIFIVIITNQKINQKDKNNTYTQTNNKTHNWTFTWDNEVRCSAKHTLSTIKTSSIVLLIRQLAIQYVHHLQWSVQSNTSSYHSCQ